MFRAGHTQRDVSSSEHEFIFNEEEIVPQASIEVAITLAEPEVVFLEAGQMIYEGEDFTVTVAYGEEARLPEGTELRVSEILPETEEYEAYINLTEEEKAAIWNVVAEQDRLFLISFICNDEEVVPQAPIEVKVTIAEFSGCFSYSPNTLSRDSRFLYCFSKQA